MAESTDGRLWHAFRNGLFNVAEVHFVAYGSDEAARLPPDLAPCATHDMNWDAHLETPATDLLLDTQLEACHNSKEESAAAKSWIYAFLGRTLFPVGARDSWNVLPVVTGEGDGKTEFVQVVRSFFNEHDVVDVGSWSDSATERVVESSVKVWTCSIENISRHEWTGVSTSLLPIISGDTVTVGHKHGAPTSAKATAPGIMEARHLPSSWIASTGLTRRIVKIAFTQTIDPTKRDGDLRHKLAQEMPTVMCRAASAYAHASRAFGSSDLWGDVMTPDLVEVPLLPLFFYLGST
jgi:hypothetical protein